MAGFSPAYSATLLDMAMPTTGATDWIGYSTNGSTEFAGMARSQVAASGGWGSAVSGSPATKANATAVNTATATSAGTITHFATFTASTAGVQKVDWTAVSASKTVAVGDSLTWPIGSLVISLD